VGEADLLLEGFVEKVSFESGVEKSGVMDGDSGDDGRDWWVEKSVKEND